MKTDGREPISPIIENQYCVSFGLIKREYFAAMAMMGLSMAAIPGTHNTTKEVVKESIARADALIEALNKEGE